MRARTRLSRVVIALTVMLISVTATHTASAQSWYANLSPEAIGATGSGFGTFTLDGSWLTIDVTWIGLSGVTTVSHIHCCTAQPNTGTVGIAVSPSTLPNFPAGFSSGNYLQTINLELSSSFRLAFLTSAGGTPLLAQNALVAGFNSGTAYFNIHSTRYAGGEIRGFIQVPEPSTWMMTLLGAGMLLVASVWRRLHVSAADL